MEASDQFRYLVGVLGEEVTRFIKRVRKQSGVPLRYLLVSEKHEDGFPHFHMLIHEQAAPVTKRLLEENWRYGFSQFRLVNGNGAKAAWYVSKYLAKDAQTRIRASSRYGSPQLVRARTEQLEAVTRIINAEKPPVKNPRGPRCEATGTLTTERVG